MAIVHSNEMEQLEALANRYLNDFLNLQTSSLRIAEQYAFRLQTLGTVLGILGLELHPVCTAGTDHVERYEVRVDV